jgi:hypothetical protein
VCVCVCSQNGVKSRLARRQRRFSSSPVDGPPYSVQVAARTSHPLSVGLAPYSVQRLGIHFWRAAGGPVLAVVGSVSAVVPVPGPILSRRLWRGSPGPGVRREWILPYYL